MKFRDAAALALMNLRKNPARTFLTILGLGVGIGAVLTVLTLGSAGEEQVEHQIDRLGVNKVWVTAETGYALAADDAGRIAAAAGADACAGAYTIGPVMHDGQTMPAQICGYDGALESVHGIRAVQGRLFAPREYGGEPVAVMDEKLAEALDGMVGDRVSVGGRSLRIVGIFTGMQVQAVQASNGMLILPLQTFLDTYALAGVSEITVAVPAGVPVQAVESAAAAALGDGFRTETLQEEIDAARSVVRIFVMVLVCVAAVCMLTGSIGVMNILLVSVRERRREIGLIKAIGGTSGQIGLLFLLESVGYALLGGLLGIALGTGMIRLFGRWIGLDAALTASLAWVAVASAGTLGVIFGVAPALRAAGLQPVDALKTD